MIEINFRQKTIIDLLSQNLNHPLKSSELASALNVSDRTIRYDIQDLNRIAHQNVIIGATDGYVLNMDVYKRYDWGANTSPLFQRIIKSLLDNNSNSVRSLSEQYFTSESTIRKLIPNIRKQLNEFDLELKISKGILAIEGNEFNKRSLIKSLIYSELNPLMLNISNLSNEFKDIDFSELNSIVSSTIEKHGFYTNDYYGQNLLLNLSIAFSRIQQKYSSSEKYLNYSINHKSMEYSIAREISEKYSNLHNFGINDYDIEYIAVLITGQIKPKYLHMVTKPQDAIISSEFTNKIETIVNKTLNYYMLNIDPDSFLTSIILHIDGLLKRSKADNLIQNNLSSELKSRYPFIYDVAVYLGNQIRNEFKVTINDSEISFLAVHIGFAIEIAVRNTPKLKVVIFTGPFFATSKELVTSLKKEYAAKIKIIAVIPGEREIELMNNADLVIATYPISIISDNIVTITPFLGPHDISKLDKIIKHIEEQKRQTDMVHYLLTRFNESLFFSNIDECVDTETTINFLSNKLEDFGVVNSNFEQMVLKREALSPTCFFDAFAIPHSTEMDAKKTMISILINDRPISWNNTPIHIVIMIAIKEVERQEFMDLYDGLTQILCDTNNLNTLKSFHNYDQLINFFTNIITSK